MIAPAKLAGIGIVSVGVVGGGLGAYYAKDYFSKQAVSDTSDSGPEKVSIRKQIENNGKKLLDKATTQARWEYKLETYKREKEHLSFKLEPEDVATLQNICETKLTSDSNEENKKLLEDLEKVCTVPSNGERLKKEKKNLIDSDVEWGKKAESYRTGNSGADTIQGVERSTADQNVIKKWCTEKTEKEFENDGDYGIFLKWCTKEGQ